MTAYEQPPATDYQSVFDPVISLTVSPTYVVKMTLTTPVLTGTYRIGWSAGIGIDTVNRSMEARIHVPAEARTVGFTRHEPSDQQETFYWSGFHVEAFAAQSRTYEMQFRKQPSAAGPGSARIEASSLEFWRVA